MQGADMEIECNTGFTALSHAQINYKKEVEEELLRRGAHDTITIPSDGPNFSLLNL